jgi:hypothetical protein
MKPIQLNYRIKNDYLSLYIIYTIFLSINGHFIKLLFELGD